MNLTLATENHKVKQEIIRLLSGDLDFHDSSSKEYTHDLHAFPARFPPQIPRLFIENLTDQGDVVVDPMSGSGTTILEAYIANRRGIGIDIDPLALHSGVVKTTPLDQDYILRTGKALLNRGKTRLETLDFTSELSHRFDKKTQEFIEYWFSASVITELLCLISEIEVIEDPKTKAFMELLFSSIIITKSGGVSSALDLAHTRPHKVANKPYRSPFQEFEKRLKRMTSSLSSLSVKQYASEFIRGNAQQLPLPTNSVDLIVNSPPYPATAIDYMRAHKFSLVWLGYPIESLSKLRSTYIGNESTKLSHFEVLPHYTTSVIERIAQLESKKAQGLSRYYSEMYRSLQEMYRVLKPGKAAILVVGSSVIRGVDTQVHRCLEEIGIEIGFEIPQIGVRSIDRNRRMLPVRHNSRRESQIENRMHEEHIIGFYKHLS